MTNHRGDEEEGPNAFGSTGRLPNQNVWDAHPDRLTEVLLEVLEKGAFGYVPYTSHCYHGDEARLFAIRRGYVTKGNYYYHLNDAGREFLTAHGKPIPATLPARDDWHGSEFNYCVWEVERNGQPYLKFAKAVYPQVATGKDPLFSRDHIIALRDYLSAWIERTNVTTADDKKTIDWFALNAGTGGD